MYLESKMHVGLFAGECTLCTLSISIISLYLFAGEREHASM